MDVSRFEEIMDDDNGDIITDFGDDCNVFQGLLIIRKYLPKAGIEGADHDVIYSCGIDKLIDAGITEEDVIKLKVLNWMTQDEYLACFV